MIVAIKYDSKKTFHIKIPLIFAAKLYNLSLMCNYF